MFTLLIFYLLCQCLLVSYVSTEKKVIITEFSMKSPIENIIWVGSEKSTVLAKTKNGYIYRSDNSGKNWINVLPLLEKAAGLSEGSKPILIKKIFYQSGEDGIMLLSQDKLAFNSNDKGATFKLIKIEGTIHNWIFHSKKAGWALFAVKTEGCDVENVISDSYNCRTNLHFTNDFCQTNTLVTQNVIQFGWGSAVSEQENYIYYTRFDSKNDITHDSLHTVRWSENVDLFVKKHIKASEQLVLKGGNRFQISNQYIFVATPQNIHLQTVKLWVSSDGGKSFKQIRLPEKLQERAYSILDASENAVMIYVNHGHHSNMETPYGHVYISDAEGISYSLSLSNNVRSATGECEFDKVSSLDGVYLANTYHEVHDDTQNNDALDEDQEGTDVQIERRKKASYKPKYSNNIRTMISFNKGGSWSYIKAPTVDSFGHKIHCETDYYSINEPGKPRLSSVNKNNTDKTSLYDDQCFLNLHGRTNFFNYPPFYSIPGAVGLIMATGNVGSTLKELGNVNTYLSRDGGYNWIEVHKGSYIYEIGDHGGLIVMAQNRVSTSKVIFTWNEGHTWYDFSLGDNLIDVDNIIIEPKQSTVQFLLYGTVAKKNDNLDSKSHQESNEGVMFHLDFSEVLPPQCAGVDFPDSVSSDYEIWSPVDRKSGEACRLGREVVYTRRKTTSKCFNGSNFVRPIIKKNCTCTESDYECEFGFQRNFKTQKCEPIDENLSFIGCTSSGVFVTKAYRKIPGDTCVNGWVPPNIQIICPNTSPFTLRAKFFLYGVLLLLLILFIRTYVNMSYPLSLLGKYVNSENMSTVQYLAVNYTNKFVDSIFEKKTSNEKKKEEPEKQNNSIKNHYDDLELTTDNLGFYDEDQAVITLINQSSQYLLQSDNENAPPLLDFSSVPNSYSYFYSNLPNMQNFPPPPQSSNFKSFSPSPDFNGGDLDKNI